MKEKDLDLDELHQAVSAMMDGKDEPKPASEHPKHGVVKTTTPRKSDHHATSDQTEPQHVLVRHAPRISVQPRRRGGAMDIVQPVAKATEPPSVRPSRVAQTVKPANNLVQPEPPKPVPITPMPEPAPQKAQPEVNDEMLASINMRNDTPKNNLGDLNQPVKARSDESWPDPLDFHEFEKEEKEPPKNPAPTITTPGSSPFVNTKVEKRPLGAFAAEPAQKAEPAGEPELPVEAEDLAQNNEPPQQDNFTQEPRSQEPAIVSQPPEPRAPSPRPNQDLQNARQMAITPQYQHAVKQPKEETRPVFDTNEYHTPLIPEHVPHHGSGRGWLVAVVILIIIIVAALVALMIIFNVIPL